MQERAIRIGGQAGNQPGWLAAWLARLGLMTFIAASLIAPGVMPARGDGGALTMVICTAQGAIEMPVPGSEAPAPRDDRIPCAFAAAHVTVAALAQPVLALPGIAPRAVRRVIAPAQPAPTYRAPRPFFARAPPVPV